ncbi:MAG: hypothetical protein AAGB93_13890 [Planctomycetota bacterium]
MQRTPALLALLATSGVALAQGPDCSTATPLSGEGAFPFTTAGLTASNFAGGGPCDSLFGSFNGDLFWQWTASEDGDFEFQIAGQRVSRFAVYDGAGCAATCRTRAGGSDVYSAAVSDVQASETLLLRYGIEVNGPLETATLTVAQIDNGCESTPDDAFEPNDTCPNAAPLADGVYPGLFVWGADPDHYLVTVPPATTLEVSWVSTGAPLRLFALDSACELTDGTSSGFFTWTNAGPSPESVTLEFRPDAFDGTVCATYDLTVETRLDPCLAGTNDPFEPNDDCQTATPAPLGTLSGLVTRDTDPDVFTTVVGGNEVLTINVGTNLLDIAELDAACGVIDSARRLYRFRNLDSTPVAVTYRVLPVAQAGPVCVEYDLSLSTTPDPCAGVPDDAFEDNDACDRAATISNGLFPSLWIDVVDDDFYRFCVPASGTLDVVLVFADNILALSGVLTTACDGAPVGSIDVNVDRLELRYENETGAMQELLLRVFNRPILGDCGQYDMSVSGACEDIGTTFCSPAGLNGAGNRATMSGQFGTGSGSGLHLEVVGGPPASFGYFLASASFSEPGVVVGNGSLCLSGTVERYDGRAGAALGSIGAFDDRGRLVNVSSTSGIGTGFDVPSSLPFIGTTIQPGDTWNFQLWYRDSGPSGATFNFSDGLGVTF